MSGLNSLRWKNELEQYLIRIEELKKDKIIDVSFNEANYYKFNTWNTKIQKLIELIKSELNSTNANINIIKFAEGTFEYTDNPDNLKGNIYNLARGIDIETYRVKIHTTFKEIDDAWDIYYMTTYG